MSPGSVVMSCSANSVLPTTCKHCEVVRTCCYQTCPLLVAIHAALGIGVKCLGFSCKTGPPPEAPSHTASAEKITSMSVVNDSTPLQSSGRRQPTCLKARREPISISEDIFENIHYVEGDFVHCLIQYGALKFIQQIYKDGTLWTPRDYRIQRTSPTEESYKEFSKCLTLILTVARRYPVKTLQRELLTYVVKQLPFFIFPPNSCRHKKQNFLIKRAKKFQVGKWEELWKLSISEFEREKSHMRPQQELSTAHKVRKAEYFHQHGGHGECNRSINAKNFS
jgi:hypothetical protein